MRSVIIPLTLLLCLTGCTQAPGRLDAKAVTAIAPDVPLPSKALQAAAAIEVDKNNCPAESALLVMCITTRDETRAITGKKIPR